MPEPVTQVNYSILVVAELIIWFMERRIYCFWTSKKIL